MKQDNSPLREAVAGLIAKHIEYRLATSKQRLVSGMLSTTSEEIVAKWSVASLNTFYILAKEPGIHQSSELAERCHGHVKHATRVRDFWRETLANVKIAVYNDGSTEPTACELFRASQKTGGGERWFSGSGKDRHGNTVVGGISLLLNGASPNYEMARRIVDTTSAASDRFSNNCDGADAVQETASKAMTSKAAANENATTKQSARVRGPQMKLPGTGTNG